MSLWASIERIRTLAADPSAGPEGTPRTTKHSNASILQELKRALQGMTRTVPEAFYYKTVGTPVGENILDVINALTEPADANDTQQVPVGAAWLADVEVAALASLEAKDAPGTRPVVAQTLERAKEQTTSML